MKGKIAIALAVVAMAALLTLQFLSNTKLRDENRALTERVAQLNQFRADSDSTAKPQPAAAPALADEQFRELLRLRGEVGTLKNRLAEQAAKKTLEPSPKPSQPENQSEPVDPEKQLALARLSFPRNWMMALLLYAQQNQGRCPTSFAQAAPFLPDYAKGETNLAPDQFEIVYEGSLVDLTNPANIIVIRQKEAWQSSDAGWHRAYGFADGHSEIYRAPDGNFGPWEQRHNYAPKDQ